MLEFNSTFVTRRGREWPFILADGKKTCAYIFWQGVAHPQCADSAVTNSSRLLAWSNSFSSPSVSCSVVSTLSTIRSSCPTGVSISQRGPCSSYPSFCILQFLMTLLSFPLRLDHSTSVLLDSYTPMYLDDLLSLPRATPTFLPHTFYLTDLSSGTLSAFSRHGL